MANERLNGRLADEEETCKEVRQLGGLNMILSLLSPHNSYSASQAPSQRVVEHSLLFCFLSARNPKSGGT